MKLIPLTNRAVLSITGKDSTSFLQGLVTNDATKISNNHIIYTLMLTPQGKFLYEFFLYAHPDHPAGERFYIDVLASEKEDIFKKLRMYTLRSEVALSQTDFEVVTTPKDTDEAELESNYSIITPPLADPRHAKMLHRSIVQPTATQNTMTDAPQAQDAYNQHRLALHVPDASHDMETGESFPLQFRMEEHNAIDYEKGCYVGQEVTARTHWRGTIRKSLFGITSADNEPLPPVGTVIYSTENPDKKLGEVRTSVKAENDRYIGLAHLDIEKAHAAQQGEISLVACNVKLHITTQ